MRFLHFQLSLTQESGESWMREAEKAPKWVWFHQALLTDLQHLFQLFRFCFFSLCSVIYLPLYADKFCLYLEGWFKSLHLLPASSNHHMCLYHVQQEVHGHPSGCYVSLIINPSPSPISDTVSYLATGRAQQMLYLQRCENQTGAEELLSFSICCGTGAPDFPQGLKS